ncbi:MAG: hypothetical protein QXZ44_03835 [Ferroplasma sp.]
MGTFKDGIFAGLKAGIIYFIIASIINTFIIYIFITEIATAYGYQATSKNLSILFTILVVTTIRDIFILGLLFGVLFSILLLKYYEILPRNSLDGKIKFMVIAYWVIFFVVIEADSLGIAIEGAVFYFIAYIVANFLLAIIFGNLLKKYNGKFIAQSS